MRQGRRVKQVFDILIILCGVSLVYYILKEMHSWRITPVFLLTVAVGMAWVLYDFFFLQRRKSRRCFHTNRMQFKHMEYRGFFC